MTEQADGIISGINNIKEALDAGKTPDKIWVARPPKNPRVKELIQEIRARGLNFQYVPIEKLNRTAGLNHQGVAASLSVVNFTTVTDLIKHTSKTNGLLLLLDRISDVRNFGAICRTAYGAGVTGIVLPEKGSANINNDAMRTSAGALHHLQIAKANDLRKVVTELLKANINVFALDTNTPQTIYDTDLTGACAIILGSEDQGVYTELLRKATKAVKIPMPGSLESLNVSVSAGIVLFEAVRQRMH